MLKRLTLEQIAANMSAGAPIVEKIRQGLSLTREEQWLKETLHVNQGAGSQITAF